MSGARKAYNGTELASVNTRVLPILHQQMKADVGGGGEGRANYGRVAEMTNLALGLLEALPEKDRVWWSLDCRPTNGEAKVMQAIRGTWGYRILNAVGRLPEDRREDAVASIEALVAQTASTPRAQGKPRRRRGG